MQGAVTNHHGYSPRTLRRSVHSSGSGLIANTTARWTYLRDDTDGGSGRRQPERAEGVPRQGCMLMCQSAISDTGLQKQVSDVPLDQDTPGGVWADAAGTGSRWVVRTHFTALSAVLHD